MLSAEDLINLLSASAEMSRRVMLAVAGPPGAGKSTVAEAIRSRLVAHGAPARVIPMDGFHLDNRLLEARGLLHRKGAPETFDAEGFVAQTKRLVDSASDVVIPVFDRAQDIAIAGAEV
ncbi:MAG: hypothetical protein AAFY73_15370, partial [Pseudomonadota bacterium]